MDVAQIYMLALRPTMIPIVGESWAAAPFFGQVEVEGWSWDLINAEEKVDSELAREKYSKRSSKLEEAKSSSISKQFENARKAADNRADERELRHLTAERTRMNDALKARQQRGENVDLTRDTKDLTAAEKRIAALQDSILERNETVRQTIERGKTQAERDLEDMKEAESEGIEREERVAQLKAKNFEFTFRKRVDISTTQLLNCLKAGDKLPTVTLTMHQASSNTPWVLVFTLTGVRLKDYKVRVEMSETMTDMKEDWTAEFEHFGYVYQNRPHAGMKSVTAGHVNTQVARAATQMTVRTFAMMPRRSVLGF